MNAEYHKYVPRDIFISFVGREALEEERWLGAGGGIVYNKHTGNEFLDVFAALVHHYMNHNTAFYARILGVTRQELSGCLKVLSGLTADEWIEAYLWLAIRDVLLNTDWKLGEIAGKMGYSSVKTFSRAFIERVKIPPTVWRRKYKT
ncbi:helix-turn-helix domain-containing protein [uncultured Parabacteroides sp.]|uniref:helix-turn-helix domain-containing protein n=1 Tax=uncultured Parabacteroides sp. TaxID=512312 RepID=UPI0025CEE6F4|nr:helix-turn-helix domain-containing protein [uncultured Parabacteroides sp.]